MTTRELVIMESSILRGTLVLEGFRVVLVTGWKEDESDVYYQVETMDSKHPTQWITGCARLIPLKFQLSDYDYKELCRLWDLNNTVKTGGYVYR